MNPRQKPQKMEESEDTSHLSLWIVVWRKTPWQEHPGQAVVQLRSKFLPVIGILQFIIAAVI